jgi:hypothetical protein
MRESQIRRRNLQIRIDDAIAAPAVAVAPRAMLGK